MNSRLCHRILIRYPSFWDTKNAGNSTRCDSGLQLNYGRVCFLINFFQNSERIISNSFERCYCDLIRLARFFWKNDSFMNRRIIPKDERERMKWRYLSKIFENDSKKQTIHCQLTFLGFHKVLITAWDPSCFPKLQKLLELHSDKKTFAINRL